MRTNLVFTGAGEGCGSLSLQVPGVALGGKGQTLGGVKLGDKLLPRLSENSSLCSRCCRGFCPV